MSGQRRRNSVSSSDMESEKKRPCLDFADQWADLRRILVTAGPMAAQHFEPSDETLELLKSTPVLIIGAGGLGCELLKNLALSGFGTIHIIDMDIIDVSNLNRQFLFRAADVGRPKAVVAAEFVQRRVSGVQVVPHYCKIQDKDEAFYRTFGLIVCGLDSLEARRWINAQVVALLRRDPDTREVDATSVVPLVDGGTEGFMGQVKLVIPGTTSCLECIVDAFAPPIAYPLCTIANTPRQPEHCIEYAALVQWNEAFPDTALDTDSPTHIDWLYEQALQRAAQFGIGGVTRSLTMGVVKRIIPAIASTNALVAAACANEALKIATGAAPQLSNFMSYHGGDAVYSYTFDYLPRDDCMVCGRPAPVPLSLPAGALVEELVAALAREPALQLAKPSIAVGSRTVYASTPPALQRLTAAHLARPLAEFVGPDGALLTVTDPALRTGVAEVRLQWRTSS